MQKGQGALEYLLLIGGAVLIAVIVITVLLGILEQGGADTTATSTGASNFLAQKRAEIVGTNVIQNASFENWAIPTIPDDWDSIGAATSSQNSDSKAGFSSVQITPTSTGGHLRWRNDILFPVFAGNTVKVTFWHKQGSGGSTTANVQVRTCVGNSGITGQVTTGPDWEDNSFNYTFPATATCVVVDLEPDIATNPDNFSRSFSLPLRLNSPVLSPPIIIP